MSCLFCKNFHAIEPPEHQKQREVGACQYSCGNKWDSHTAARYVKEHKQFLDGLCLLNPRLEKTNCGWICAQFQDGFHEAWHIGQPGEHQNILDWAREKMETHMHGGYQDRELDRLREDNATLKHALKAARQRSAARLARLNKKQPRKEERPKPVPLHLVAAE